MSIFAINEYYNEVESLVRFSGSRNETTIRTPFVNLINAYARPLDYRLATEVAYETASRTTVKPDGTLKDALRISIGWWESKDENDDLDEEIEKKFAKGYPRENILFEDSQTAVLFQNGQEVLRTPIAEAEALDRLLTAFVSYERPVVRDFRKAIAQFREDIPDILAALRATIATAESENAEFRQRRDGFLEICKTSINPQISIADIHEMLIQHILTEDIFTNIFRDSQFHRENNIAREVGAIVETFFAGAVRRNTLRNIEGYYAAIRSSASEIANHHEKQKFLKAVYENFYQAYNPKAADRLGIVYTPNEIVRFMVEGTDRLTYQHFGKFLSDEGVEILDPCTGTGTFITELIEYIPARSLKYKYENEIHCNELAILPYYIANLNIESTYAQKMKEYVDFVNLCLMDTLDLATFGGKQLEISFSDENTERIIRQNKKAISVIIGNPPYNANQYSANDTNANRSCESVDARIAETYVSLSDAQKTKAYDPYCRFLRWATDRASSNAIIAFVTNSSFIRARSFNGLRRSVEGEFRHAYIIDLGGDSRSADRSGNVFGVRVGIAISFWVKGDLRSDRRFHYFNVSRALGDEVSAQEKMAFLSNTSLSEIPWETLQLDENGDWLDRQSQEFKSSLPLIEKHRDRRSVNFSQNSIFAMHSLGIVSNRDDWVYDFSRESLVNKVGVFIETYMEDLERWIVYKRKPEVEKFVNRFIKWTSELEKYLTRETKLSFSDSVIRSAAYRPFIRKWVYYDRIVIHRPYRMPEVFPIDDPNRSNIVIYCTDAGTQSPFMVTVCTDVPDSHLVGTTAKGLPLYRYDPDSNRQENITDWGLTQLQTHYTDPTITKPDIFHYTYAVLHHPAYRQKYEIDLKRDFPRLPLYPDFHQWAEWGKQLMDWHINYETIEPYGLQRHAIDHGKKRPPAYKAKLKADKNNGQIILDTETTLTGVPEIAWSYKLGNRSAIEWVLDQHKEKRPRDPTIRELFNTYRFADYKEKVIDLLDRVCTVSVRTMELIAQMPDAMPNATPDATPPRDREP